MDQRVSRDRRVSRRIGILALLFAASLGGCGRKGPLELPPNAPAQSQVSDDTQSRVLPIPDSPGLIQPPNKFVDRSPAEKLDQAVQTPSKPINDSATTAKKPFFLDPLL